ncbi:acetylcholine receptor subunit beta-type unc-29-like [Nymphalis io]|uniref:acetylcholine receptor subunit beta-type unc-29-like n=1 Tax=Inachis io TaxID=171585 RepID=UPI0021690693|nr:acetylcholine receptor subunit beta-type unc-29-like [Nymphalis io]
MLLATIVLTILVKYVSLECVIDNRSPTSDWEERLSEHFKCNYKENILPNENSTTVAIQFILKNFFFDSDEVLFTIHSLMFFSWNDPRLKWNPDDFGGIDNIVTHSVFIWTPFSYLHQTKDVDKMSTFKYHTSNCQISCTGRIVCVPRVIHTTTCSSKLHNWPYDIQRCSFNFYIRNENKDKVKFTFNSTRGLSAFGAEYGSGWDIIDYETGENATGETKIYLNFVVERQALGCAAMIVVPSITVAILTMTSMVLDVENNIRFGLSIFNLFCNFCLLKTISEIIPHHGSDTPSILYFIHSSIYITVCSICLILILSSLTRKRCLPHPWIISFNDHVFNHPIIKHLVFGKWMETSVKSPDEADYVEKWSDFTFIINSLMFLIILIVYLILFLVFIPQPTTTY